MKSSEYLYNFDDSADFIYVDYEDWGYAVFLTSTLELLEYSPKGSLPFSDTKSKKYYSGPANYFNKSGEYFVDIISKEAIHISKDEVLSFSKQARELFSDGKEKFTYDLPTADIPDKCAEPVMKIICLMTMQIYRALQVQRISQIMLISPVIQYTDGIQREHVPPSPCNYYLVIITIIMIEEL